MRDNKWLETLSWKTNGTFYREKSVHLKKTEGCTSRNVVFCPPKGHTALGKWSATSDISTSWILLQHMKMTFWYRLPALGLEIPQFPLRARPLSPDFPHMENPIDIPNIPWGRRPEVDREASSIHHSSLELMVMWLRLCLPKPKVFHKHALAPEIICSSDLQSSLDKLNFTLPACQTYHLITSPKFTESKTFFRLKCEISSSRLKFLPLLSWCTKITESISIFFIKS